MFHNRIFKVLSNLILLVVFGTGQATAAPTLSDLPIVTPLEQHRSTNPVQSASEAQNSSIPFTIDIIEFSSSPTGMFLDPANGFLYVADSDGIVSVIQASSVIATINVDTAYSTDAQFVKNTATGNLYLTRGLKEIFVIKGTQLLTTIDFEVNVTNLAYNPVDENMYVQLALSLVAVVNGINVINTIQLPGSDWYHKPHINPINGYVYNFSYFGQSVSILNASGILAYFSLGFVPHGSVSTNIISGLTYVGGSKEGMATVGVLQGTSLVDRFDFPSGNGDYTYIYTIATHPSQDLVYALDGGYTNFDDTQDYARVLKGTQVRTSLKPLGQTVQSLVLNPISQLVYVASVNLEPSESFFSIYTGTDFLTNIIIPSVNGFELHTASNSKIVVGVEATPVCDRTQLVLLEDDELIGTVELNTRPKSVEIAPDNSIYLRMSCETGIRRITTGYSISGRVVDGSLNGIAGVSLSDGAGHSALTDNSGNYTIGGLVASTYTLTAVKSGSTFTPVSRTVAVPPNKTTQDFVAVSGGDPPIQFLDLPFNYGGTTSGFIKVLRNWSFDGGQINSWFDHKYPLSSNWNKGDGLWLYKGDPHTQDSRSKSKTVLCYGDYCYDGHNGYDLIPNPKLTGQTTIHPAASGKVVLVKSGCVKNILTDGCGDFGNYVVLYHADHGYFTLYGHLLSVNTSEGLQISPLDTIGEMGSTGNSVGTHLHFGVYKDNGNDQWNGESVDKPVDPFGWRRDVVDPWVADLGGPTSYPLWLHDPDQVLFFSGDQGATMMDSSGKITAISPPNLFLGQVTLSLSDSPVAASSAQLRSSGQSFFLKLLAGVMGTGSGQTINTAQASAQDILEQSITLSITYDDASLKHLNTTDLSLYHWDEIQSIWQPLNTTVDANNHIAIAQTQELGYFDLQAPLLCPSDGKEPNDSYFASNPISSNGTPLNSLFDIAQDEDWFEFNAVAGKYYSLKTTNLVAGVDTALEIYDTDGITFLTSNDNGGGGNASLLTWQAPQTGLYFARVAQASGSSFGCGSTYDFSVAILNTTIPRAPIVRSPRANTITNDTTPTFWWANVSGAQNYEIVVATNNTFTANVNSQTANGSPYTPVAPFGDGKYYLRVRAYNAINQPGAWSSSRVFTIDTTPPSIPVLSSPLDNTSTLRTPTFKWLSVPFAVSYQFQYGNDVSVSSPIYTVTVRGTFRRPPAMPNGTYYWRVRAKDVVGNWSLWSDPFTITITSP